MDFAGQRYAIPLRTGNVKVERRMREEVLIDSYRTRFTVSGEPAVGR